MISSDLRHIGANVKADNDSAITCYRKLGFEVVASYGEFLFKKDSIPGGKGKQT